MSLPVGLPVASSPRRRKAWRHQPERLNPDMTITPHWRTK